MLIRKIMEQDLIDCSKILKNEYSSEPYNEEFIDNNELKYIELKYKNNKDACFIIEDNEKVIWFCFASISYWTNWLQWILEEIVISKEYQWKWVWKQIYNFMENYFKDLWAKSLMLWVKNDTLAYHFHLKNGFFKSDEHSIMFKNL